MTWVSRPGKARWRHTRCALVAVFILVMTTRQGEMLIRAWSHTDIGGKRGLRLECRGRVTESTRQRIGTPFFNFNVFAETNVDERAQEPYAVGGQVNTCLGSHPNNCDGRLGSHPVSTCIVAHSETSPLEKHRGKSQHEVGVIGVTSQ